MLRHIRQRSLAKLRHEVEPVSAAALGRLATTWHGLGVRRSGLDALLDAIEQLQGAPLPASLLEREILPSRLDGYRPGDLDVLTSAGEITWVGVEPLGDRDGRIAVYLADHLAKLLPPRAAAGELDDRADPNRAAPAPRGCVVLRRRPPGGRGRLPARDGGRAVGPGVARAGHQRHVPPAARVHAAASETLAGAATERSRSGRAG